MGMRHAGLITTTNGQWHLYDDSDRSFVAFRIWLRHMVRRHPASVDALEWGFAASISVALTVATLIANA